MGTVPDAVTAEVGPGTQVSGPLLHVQVNFVSYLRSDDDYFYDVKFDMFADPKVCGPMAVAAMNFLANVDAIIFDLRGNRGGDAKMMIRLNS